MTSRTSHAVTAMPFSEANERREQRPTERFQNAAYALLWDGVRTTAMQVAAAEPFLTTHLEHTILKAASPAEMLAAVLASKLAGGEFPQAELHHLFMEICATDIEFMSEVTEDLMAVRERDPACPHHLHVLLNLKGFHALQTYRAAHRLWRAHRRELAFALSSRVAQVLAIDIHPAAHIGRGVMIDHGTGVVIGETAVVEDHVSILHNVTLGGSGKEQGDRHPKIRRGVLLGAGATVLGNIEVGAMSKVAAGSVVLRDVPSHCTVAGVPARVVREHAIESCPSEEMDQSI